VPVGIKHALLLNPIAEGLALECPKIQHHGDQDGVIGSDLQLDMNASAGLLADCGLFEGDERPLRKQRAVFPMDFHAIPSRHLLAYVHIVHVGHIPTYWWQALKGPILCSYACARLLPFVLADAFKLSLSPTSGGAGVISAWWKVALPVLPYRYAAMADKSTGGAWAQRAKQTLVTQLRTQCAHSDRPLGMIG